MNPDKIYFTSDTHFGHQAILTFCNRPAGSVDEMDDMLIDSWNAVVPEDGRIYHLGDLSFHGQEKTREILDELNGHKYLVAGNHDNRMALATKDMFEWVKPYHELTSKWDNEKIKIVLCHFAFRHWNKGHHGSWNLHGHSHGNLKANGKQLDVGVDTNGLRPYTFYDVAKIMKTRNAWQPDNYGAR